MVIWGGPHCISVPDRALQQADGVEGDEVVVDRINNIEAGSADLFSSKPCRSVNPPSTLLILLPIRPL